MQKHKKKIIGTAIGLAIVLVFSLMMLPGQKANIVTVSAQELSNQKIGWGIKRNDKHEQPDLGAKNKQIIEEYQGIAMGNKDSKQVYLTFDEGYEAGYTEKILDVLKENEVKAAFFITAHYVNTNADLVKRMLEEGHIVGNHTVNHKSMPDLSLEEIKKEVMDLHTSIYERFGYEMKYIRPPKGEYSERTVAYCQSLGYTTVMWSFAYDDWNEDAQKGESYAKKKILDNIHSGAVILLHGNSKDNSNVLAECIQEIKAQGYTFSTLDQFER